MNHGSEEDASARRHMPTPAFPLLSDLLVRLGFAVLTPLRPGHGASGGEYLESQGRCGSADYVKAGQGAAASILTALRYMQEQDFIQDKGAVVIGNSAGGWGALAVAASNPPSVSAVVNFAGGRGGRDRNIPNRNCSPDRLVTAAGIFGDTARVPTLWLYARNDSYFAPDLSTEMAEAFRQSGGNVDYHLFPSIPGDGHSLIFTSSESAPWQSIVAKFLWE